MNKHYFLILLLALTTNIYSQCWQSIGRIDNDSVPTSFAIKEDGTLWVWGENRGLYGNGNQISSTVPVQVNNETNWKSITYSWGSVYAIKTDGTLWTWGYSNPNPKQFGTDNQWKEISTGYGNGYGTFALKNNGTLWTLGKNSSFTMIGFDTDWKTVFVP